MDKTSDIDYLDKVIDFCKSTNGEEIDILVAGKRIRFHFKAGKIRSIIEPAFYGLRNLPLMNLIFAYLFILASPSRHGEKKIIYQMALLVT